MKYKKEYDETINEVYGVIDFGYIRITAAEVLEENDQLRYQEGYKDYLSANAIYDEKGV